LCSISLRLLTNLENRREKKLLQIVLLAARAAKHILALARCSWRQSEKSAHYGRVSP